MNTSNKRTPKLLSLLLAVCMVLSLLPMAALAAETDISIDEAHFPDKVFRTYVQENFDKDGNASLSAAEAAAVTEIDVGLAYGTADTLKIHSLQGIEFFTQLTKLNCKYNQLTSLDLSNNPNLDFLNCNHNQITSLDLSNNPKLEYVECSENPFTSLDFSHNPNLTHLSCNCNQLTSLDLSKNPKLKILWCKENQLTSLDMSHNPNLTELRCKENQLTSLNLSRNPEMTVVHYNSYIVFGEVIKGNEYTVNQRENITLPGNFDASRVSNVVGGKFDAAKNTFSFDANVNEATYDYNTGYTGLSEFEPMNVTLTYQEPPKPEPTEPDTKPTEPETKPTEPKPTEPHVHKFGDWVITKEPTSTTEGKETRTCSCGKQETRKIPKLSNPFKDISAEKYFYEPVLWAVNKGITSGVSPNEFGPSINCTRGQIATFLWAAAGKPEPTSTNNPFIDVVESDYYYKAVLWAVEKGITSGMSADKFGPNVTCTRAQTVTFLYKTFA